MSRPSHLHAPPLAPAPGRAFRAAERRAARALALLACLLAGAGAALAASEEVAVISTPYGEIAWRFLDAAPNHAAYVKELIRRGFYDGTTFHRVIPHFVIQGGDPLSKNDDRGDDGDGEADRRLKAEFSTTLHYRPGTVGMARDADPDSGSCQFFIALENIPRLDGKYTIFGEVTSGLDVARRIADLPRDLNDNPLSRVTIRARLERREVPSAVLSREAGAAGEVLTGPDKPKPYDPGNVLWKAPALVVGPHLPDPSEVDAGTRGGAAPAGAPRWPRVDLSISPEGKVLDVRFVSLDTPEPDRLREAALAWVFTPATYDGHPVKARFEIDSNGGRLGPPTGGGAPVEAGDAGVTPPSPIVRVDLPAGKKAPAAALRLRLTIDASGAVTEAALQTRSGNPDLDAAAVEAAKRMIFAPATRTRPGRKEPEPIACYLDTEVRFVETPASSGGSR